MALEKAKQAKAAEELKALNKKKEQEQRVSHIMTTDLVLIWWLFLFSSPQK